MRNFAFCRHLPVLCLFSLVLAGAACRPDTENTNSITNSNYSTVSNVNSNSNANSTATTITGDAIDVREPDSYKAKLTLKLESVSTQQTLSLPPLTADVAKSGTDSRVAINLPGGNTAIYLDKGDKHYLILPARKQYAELNSASTGVEWQRLMTPGQIVTQLKHTNAAQKIGDDQWQGRSATKYRIAGTAKTNTQQAGDVSADALIYIDKDTGLPLHTETLTFASGEKAQGVQGRVVTEMSDISTTVDPSAFELPHGYSKIPDEQVRQEVDKAENVLFQIAGKILSSMQNGPAPAPSASASVSPTVKP
jgi:hypothetical protein